MSDFWQNQFCRVVEIAFYGSKWWFWGTFPEKNIKFLWCQDSDRKTFGILAKILGRFLTPAVYVSWGTFCGLKLLEILKFFDHFPSLREKESDFWHRLPQSCQNCILPVQMTFLRIFFSGKECKFFMVLTLWPKNLRNFGEDFRQVSNTCSLRLMRKVLWKKNSGKFKVFFINSGVCAKTYPTFGAKASAELSKLHLTCPDERFKEHFFWKKISISMV